MQQCVDKIIEIINLWDPIGIFPMAPKDEYEIECKEIYCFLKSNPQIQEAEFCKKINDIFSKSFGADVYNSDVQKTFDISQKILDIIRCNNNIV